MDFLRSILIAVATSGTILLCGVGNARAVECNAQMYRNAEFTEPQTHFSPYDRIFIVIDCFELPAGEHVMHTNWIHTRRGLIRSNKHPFSQPADGKRSVYFWFKLTRRGPLASALTNRDFHEENFGEWLVEVYLNDELMVTRDFSITPEIR